MFLWNMSLETGIETIDGHRRRLIEAMANFFLILDDAALSQRLVAERTGAIYTAMKATFAAEDEVLNSHGEAGEMHMATHATLLAAYIELCRKVVPKIKNVKQARQICLEIFTTIEKGLYIHIKDEALGYRSQVKARKTA